MRFQAYFTIARKEYSLIGTPLRNRSNTLLGQVIDQADQGLKSRG